MEKHVLFPKGLIREAYRIEGISGAECRSIFLDWALSSPTDTDLKKAADDLLQYYAGDVPDHPMTQVLREGAQKAIMPRRRGGWRSRVRG